MESAAISFPVYLRLKDCGEVISFSSIAQMQMHIEPIDVRNNEYEGWDAEGGVVQLTVGSGTSEWLQILKTDQVLPQSEFAQVKGKANPYRFPEPLLRTIGRRLGLLKADG
ncbi:MAG TPA: hypothetical protein VIG91_09995 [Terriglobales bacterium]